MKLNPDRTDIVHFAAPTQLPVLLRSIAFRQPKRPQLNISWDRPEDVPTVDILITCCGEDLDVLLDTVRATCNIDYPAERFRVFLSDDARSAELRTAVESLDIIGPKLIYTAREKPAVKDYKAGNLNHGLKFSKSLPNQSWRMGTHFYEEMPGSQFPSKKSSAATLVGSGSDLDEMPKPIAKALPPTVYELEDTSAYFSASEYVVGIDADMIPERHILRALLPHMVNDAKMAMACPPQVLSSNYKQFSSNH
jgi:cellulose synthase/poly-beta-1,6-N-acetylglucosamine synthase-like glycosyltransferase